MPSVKHAHTPGGRTLLPAERPSACGCEDQRPNGQCPHISAPSAHHKIESSRIPVFLDHMLQIMDLSICFLTVGKGSSLELRQS